MKKMVVVCFMILFWTGAASAVVIDTSGLVAGQQVAYDFWVADGVLLDKDGTWYKPGGWNVITNLSDPNTIHLSFTQPVNDLSLLYSWNYNGGPYPVMRIYSFIDVYGGTVPYTYGPGASDGSGGDQVINFGPDSNLVSLWISLEDHCTVGIHQMSFNPANSVPIPAPLLLLASGLLGVSGIGRKTVL